MSGPGVDGLDEGEHLTKLGGGRRRRRRTGRRTRSRKVRNMTGMKRRRKSRRH
jgi:hypothetical protein